MAISCNNVDCPKSFVDGACEECGKPEPSDGVVNSHSNTGTLSSASAKSILMQSTGSVKNTGTATRAGGYTTGRVTGARRPHAANASGTGTHAGTGTGSAHQGTGSRSHRSSRGSSSRRRRLGGGLIALPVPPSLDPMKKVMANPRIPPSKVLLCDGLIEVVENGDRKQKKCNTRLNPEKKFCPNCGNEYNFKPKLKAGDIVANEYEVMGPIAFGGLGWIYLAMDRTLNRWVVLKGLLNSKDTASAAAAVAERQFLAAIKHGKIMGIYRFVESKGEPYMVMEYVNGRTIMEIRKERGPLPIEEANAYGLGIMPAMGYLHEQGIINPDFSPDNFMLESDGKDVDVKLIDAGAFRRIDDTDGDVYGKPGYLAPEAADEPSVASDIFTIGRTLAVMIMDFDYQRKYQFSLPEPSELQFVVPKPALQLAGLNPDSSNLYAQATLGDGTALPDWLRFGQSSSAIVVTTSISPNPVNILVTARDETGRSTVIPIVLPANEWRVSIPQEKLIAAGLSNQNVQYTATLVDGNALPEGLKIQPGSLAFNGQAPEGVSAVDVKVNVRDDNGNTVTLPWTISLPLAANESLYRFLLKATAYEPDQRFQTIAEMEAQWLGVQREIISRARTLPSADSTEFLRERNTVDPRELTNSWRRLPTLQLDAEDSGVSEVSVANDLNELESLIKKYPLSSEARLRMALMLLEQNQGNLNTVMPYLDQAVALDNYDWRPDWYCGLLYLSMAKPAEAIECFDKVYNEIPGEQVPRVALAIALEMENRWLEAAGLYESVFRTDPALTMAAFGFARCTSALGNRATAVKALESVPSSSSVYTFAQMASVRMLLDNSKQPPSQTDLVQASSILAGVNNNNIEQHETEAGLILEAIGQIEKGSIKPSGDVQLLGVRLRIKDLRKRAEQALLACSKLVKEPEVRIAYIDMANWVRPVTSI